MATTSHHTIAIREAPMVGVPGGVAFWWHCSCAKFARHWSSDRGTAERGGAAHVRSAAKPQGAA